MKKYIQTLLFFFSLFIIHPCIGQLNLENIKTIVTNEAMVNSEFLEYSPAFYEDGIVFVSTKPPSNKFKVKDRRINKNIMSTYWSRRSDAGILEAAIPYANELMTTFHEGPLTFDRTGELMFFTRNNYIDGKRKKSSDGVVKLKIFSAQKVGSKWANISELPFNDDEFNTAHPSISVDGDLLYFTSDRPGGYGGMDLYVSTFKGDEWLEPLNLGPTINTEKDDIFPYIHADGTLYFASSGHGGLGELDIYMVNKKEMGWEAPVNLGRPFNSEFDDFGFIMDRDKKNGYFSSNREGGRGEDDIYSFFVSNEGGELEAKKVWVTVIDKVSGEIISEATIATMNLSELEADNIVSEQNGDIATLQPGSDPNELILKLIMDGEKGMTGLTDSEGKFPLKLLGPSHVMNVSKAGFQTKQVILNYNNTPEELIVALEKAEGCIPVNGVVFEQASGAPFKGANINISDESGASITDITTDNYGNFQYCLKRNQVYKVDVSKNGQTVSSKQLSTIDTGADDENPLTLSFDVAGVSNPGTSSSSGGTSGSVPNTSGTSGTTGVNYGEVPNTSGTTSSTSGSSSSSSSVNFGGSNLSAGTIITLSNIYYNFNDSSIRPDAAKSLDVLAEMMLSNPGVAIEILSHTDSRGGTRYNKKLSQKRAEKAVAYLSKKGIARERLTPRGMGESELRNHCSDGVKCSDDEHQYNRRTEVKILSTDGNFAAQTTSTSYTGSSSSSHVTGGSFQVITGTYKKESNAFNKLDKVKGLGYSNARIINSGNGLHFVCVGEFDNLSSAQSLLSEIEGSHNVNAYVKRVK